MPAIHSDLTRFPKFLSDKIFILYNFALVVSAVLCLSFDRVILRLDEVASRLNRVLEYVLSNLLLFTHLEFL